jgi:hypothetical protein
MEVPDFSNLARNLSASFRDTQRIVDQIHAGPKTITLIRKQVKAMSIDQLQGLLLGEGREGGMLTMPTLEAIRAEITIRTSRPHWSMTPAFWIALVLGFYGAVVASLAYWRPRPQTQASPVGGIPPGNSSTSPSAPR